MMVVLKGVTFSEILGGCMRVQSHASNTPNSGFQSSSWPLRTFSVPDPPDTPTLHLHQWSLTVAAYVGRCSRGFCIQLVSLLHYA